MQRLSGKGPSCKDLRTNKIAANSSKTKKELKHSSSKNLKTLKGISHKALLPPEQSKIKQSTSPEISTRGRETDNDYGVNPYYSRYKVKTSQKKQTQPVESADYGTFNSSRDTVTASPFQARNQRGSGIKVEESDYAENAFQKIKLPNNRGLINAEGKFVSAKRQKQHANHSFHQNSTSKHSFSLNFTSRDESRYRKKTGKSKSKQLLQAERSREYRMKCKSMQKTYYREHHSYYQKSRQKPKVKNQRKRRNKSIKPLQECDKIASINSKTTSIGTDVAEIYSALCLTQDNSFVDSVKDEIQVQINKFNSLIKKYKFSDGTIRERMKCLSMLSRICSTMNMKREIFYLSVHYLDQFISQFSYQSMKLIALGSLTLALKMDDAQMTSKFCYNYLYNPQRTVKKGGSSKYSKIKQKRQSITPGKEDGKELRSKLSTILSSKISEDKKPIKEDFALEEVLDFQTQIMVKFNYRLIHKTLNYWIDMLTALWDSYVVEFCPKYIDSLTFRNEKTPRNLSYVLQLIQLQILSMETYSHSKVSIVLAAIYLVARMALQQKKEETPWEELCRYYKVSLSKTSNLIFCDGVGINILFGDFLTLFQLSMANIIQCVQSFSRYLQPELIKIHQFRRIQGLNRQDRLATHIHSDELFRVQTN